MIDHFASRLRANEDVTVYEPDQAAKMGFVSCWLHMARNLIRSRDLVWQLFKRDFLAAYKQSALGIFWIIVSPLIGILSWLFMNLTGILNPGDVGVPYPVYLLFGTTIWGLFMGLYSSSAGSLSSSGSLILQVNFSHEALVAQQVAQAIAAFIANALTLVLVLAIYNIWPSWRAIFLPFALIPLFCLATGIGMVVSVLSVVVRDINKIVGSALALLMFITPVIYAPRFDNNLLQQIIWWNPLSYLIGGARDLALFGRVHYLDGYLWSTVMALGVFLLGWKLFFVSERKVAEKF